MSDYAILVLMQHELDCDFRVWQKIEAVCVSAKLSATPFFIQHCINFMNHELERGQYFFFCR
jgi:hypothetical protein